jgi:hypothetical protein
MCSTADHVIANFFQNALQFAQVLLHHINTLRDNSSHHSNDSKNKPENGSLL